MLLSDLFCVLKTLTDDNVTRAAGRGLRGRAPASGLPVENHAESSQEGIMPATKPSAERPS